MSNQLFGGSICITDLMDMLNKQHSAFTKSAKNNKVYGSVLIWVNEEPDEYGNSISLQLSSVKEKRDQEKEKFGKGYIGNAKKLETNKPVSSSDMPSGNWDVNVPVATKENNAAPIADDLPF